MASPRPTATARLHQVPRGWKSVSEPTTITGAMTIRACWKTRSRPYSTERLGRTVMATSAAMAPTQR